MQETVDDFTQKEGVEHFLSRYAFLAPLNAFAATYNGPATDYNPPEPTYSPARSYSCEPQRFPSSDPLKTKIELQKADKKEDLERQLQSAQEKLAREIEQAGREHAELSAELQQAKDDNWLLDYLLRESKHYHSQARTELQNLYTERTQLKQQCEDAKKDKKKQLKSCEQLQSQLLQAEKDHAQTKSALEAATDKKNMDLERQRQEDRRDSHQKIIQAEMRGIARLEQAKKDKQHLERCLEKANDKRRQDNIRAQDERMRLEQRLAETIEDKDQLKSEAQRTAAELVKEQKRCEEIGNQCDDLKKQIQDTRKTTIQLLETIQDDLLVKQQLQESRDEAVRTNWQLCEHGIKHGELQRSVTTYAQAKEHEVQEAKEEAARLGSQLEEVIRDHSQCRSHIQESKEEIVRLESRIKDFEDSKDAAQHTRVTSKDILVDISSQTECTGHNLVQEHWELVQANEDLKTQLAQIEVYVESFIQERHRLRDTTQATPEVDQRRDELRLARKSI